MQAELEARDDAEVPAAATNRPEQVGILGCTGATHLSIGCDDLDGQDVVAGESVLAHEPAKPAA